MLITTTPLLAALLLSRTHAFPYPLPNSTTVPNSTICNSTLSLCDTNLTSTADLPPLTPGEYKCIEVYPADLAVVNSRYPDYDVTHLHQANKFFMLRRQFLGDGEIATRVQFLNLPLNSSNLTCRLEFVLPDPSLQLIQGPNPSFNVYQVQREVGSVATWKTYEEDNGAEVFGAVNGEPEALTKTRHTAGVAAINETTCNQTLSFQMRMMHDSVEVPNY
ncbi:Nn.00g041000.m01.CDS01 [Neocucurbitaria sp. VM-36]